MRFFIANCTKQSYHLASRIPEMSGVKIFEIPIGGQMQIAGDLNQMQIEAIIDQHRMYGLASVAEFERVKEFVPLVYSEGKAVSADVIRRCMALNNGVLIQRGRDMRKQAAVATSESISQTLAELSNQSPELERLNMSVVEESRGDLNEGDPMNEGVRVEREPGQPAPVRNKGGRPRKPA